MKREPEKVKITEKALYQRINRKLKANDEILKRSRGRWATELGDYYVVDVGTSGVVSKDVDIEAYGRKLGVLRPYEALEEVR
ncbi:MAG: hypothetical protein WB341_05315 [Terracidiphilus sp.]